jgi:hypothetical protein
MDEQLYEKNTLTKYIIKGDLRLQEFIKTNREFDIETNETDYVKFRDQFRNQIIIRGNSQGIITSLSFSWPNNPDNVLALLIMSGDVQFMPEIIYDLITTEDWKYGYISTTLNEYYDKFSKRYFEYMKEEMDFLPHNIFDDLFLYESHHRKYF